MRKLKGQREREKENRKGTKRRGDDKGKIWQDVCEAEEEQKNKKVSEKLSKQ